MSGNAVSGASSGSEPSETGYLTLVFTSKDFFGLTTPVLSHPALGANDPLAPLRTAKEFTLRSGLDADAEGNTTLRQEVSILLNALNMPCPGGRDNVLPSIAHDPVKVCSFWFGLFQC